MKFFSRSPKAQPKEASQAGHRELTKREARYGLRAPMRYRRSGHMGWSNGTTINMSKSGILFTGDTAFPPGTAVELSVSVPQKGSNDPKILSMSCVISRHRKPEPGEKSPVMAARIVK